MNIDDLIEFESEHTGLDFKATQYRKETFYELLKDVIAMANAAIDGERLIVVGVKKKPDGSFSILPIPKDEFIDSAIYQKLILDNIEPELHIEYIPYLYKGTDLIGLLKIPAGSDKPYMMKKLFGSDKAIRREGESFIRKGTTTKPLMRRDIDYIYEQKYKADIYVHQVAFYFSDANKNKVIELHPAEIGKLPSERAADKIKSIIERKEEEEKVNKISNFSKMLKPVRPFFQSVSYEERTLEELRENLAVVHDTYQKDDYYEVFEKSAEKINITILNEGSKYVEDATIEVEIPEIEGLLVSENLYRKPKKASNSNLLGVNPHLDIDHERISYPKYQKLQNSYRYSINVGNIRHLQPIEVFDVPVRITIAPILLGSEIEVKIKLYGKDLPTPITDSLLIKVIG